MNKKRSFAFSRLTHALILAALLPKAYGHTGSNFTITAAAGTTLPTSVISGQTVTAYYTVKNKTSSVRSGYSIVGLPSTVTQNTAAGNCPAIITLSGQATCTLVLEISGEAKGNFAICKGNSCTTACVGLDVSVTTSSSAINLIAAGQYNSTGAVRFPILAHSTSTTPWTYPITSNAATLPGDFLSGGQFLAASCSGNICVAGGSYTNSLSNVYPLLAASSNGGSTWNYPSTIISNVPVDYDGSYGVFNSVSCYGTTCIADGEDSTASSSNPILAQSNDSGTTWTYPIGNPGSFPADYGVGGSGLFNGASCSSTSCLGAGSYENSALATYPLLARSPLGVTTWTYPIDSTGALPLDYSGAGTFNGVSCSGNLCVAGGTYNNGTTAFPMLALSTNGGINWTYPIYSGGPLPSDYSRGGTFYDVRCYGQMCLAGGTYVNTGSATYPLLAQTINGGATWTYPVSSSYLPPGGFTSGYFNSVSCASNICIAAGTYSTGGIDYPLLAQSTNGGATWTYPVYAAGILPADFVSNGVFYSASCGSQNTCIAVGSYVTTLTTQLLLIETTNGGVTWSYPSSIITQEPGDYVFGQFNGSTVTPFKKKMKSLTSQVRDALKIRG